ncbi:MAG: HD domain-containing protein [Desulfobacteraceae bacterium]
MTENEFSRIKAEFSAYADGFISRADDPAPFVLKKEHSLRVCRNVNDICQSIRLSSKEFNAAKISGLLHDIGRFRQFKNYGTFVDSLSENHAALGCRVIKENHLLDRYDDNDQKRIMDAVFYHNMYKPPQEIQENTLLLTRILRDADKLDILEVMTRQYLAGEGKQDSYVILNLPDDGNISAGLMDDIFQKRVADGSRVKRLNDLKLLQISWIFDLNFEESIIKTKENRYMEKIFSTMPATDQLNNAKTFIKSYISKKMPQ